MDYKALTMAGQIVVAARSAVPSARNGEWRGHAAGLRTNSLQQWDHAYTPSCRSWRSLFRVVPKDTAWIAAQIVALALGFRAQACAV